MTHDALRLLPHDGVPNGPGLPVIAHRGAVAADGGAGGRAIEVAIEAGPDRPVVGAYPRGRRCDVRRGAPGDGARARTPAPAGPGRDPVRGDDESPVRARPRA